MAKALILAGLILVATPGAAESPVMNCYSYSAWRASLETRAGEKVVATGRLDANDNVIVVVLASNGGKTFTMLSVRRQLDLGCLIGSGSAWTTGGTAVRNAH